MLFLLIDVLNKLRGSIGTVPELNLPISIL